MWIFTRHGFFSITKSPTSPGRLQIRARCRHDLEALKDARGCGARIIETPPPADYRWRIVVSPEEAVAIVSAEVECIDYGNFKAEVHATPGQENKDGPYMRVWSAMLAVQTAEQSPEPPEEEFPRDTFTRDTEPDFSPTCTCGHDVTEHLHGVEHCLGRNLTGSNWCACREFKPAASALDNPKAPAGKKRRKSAAALRQAVKGGGK